MAQIKSLKTEKYFLPSFNELPEDQRGWVTLETPLRMADMQTVPSGFSQVYQTAFIIAIKIKDWNIADENNNKLPISAENVLLLSPEDVGSLSLALELDKMMERLSKLKKNN